MQLSVSTPHEDGRNNQNATPATSLLEQLSQAELGRRHQHDDQGTVEVLLLGLRRGGGGAWEQQNSNAGMFVVMMPDSPQLHAPKEAIRHLPAERQGGWYGLHPHGSAQTTPMVVPP